MPSYSDPSSEAPLNGRAPSSSHSNGHAHEANDHTSNGHHVNGAANNATNATTLAVPAPQATGSQAVPTTYLPAMMGGRGDDERGLDVRELLAMLLRRRKALLGTFLSVFLAGMTWTLLQKPVYQTNATVRMNLSTGKGQPASADLPVLSDFLETSSTRSLETQVEVMKSAPVQDAAMKRLTPDQQRALSRYLALSIDPVRGTDVVTLSVRSQRPDAAPALANALCDEYIAASKSENSRQIRAATRYVEDQLLDVRKRLDEAQTALKNYQQEAGTADLPAETQAQVGSLATLEANLRAARAERDAAQAKLVDLRAQLSRLSPEQTRPSSIGVKPEVTQLRARIQELETERATKALTFRESSQEMRDVNRRLAEARAQLKSQSTYEVQSYVRAPNEAYNAIASQIATLQADVNAGESRASTLADQVVTARGKLSQLPERAYRLSKLAAEVGVQQQTAQMLNEKYQTLRISLEADVPSASVLSPAKHAWQISPQRTRNAIMFLVLGAILGVAMAALLDRMDDRVHSDDDVEAATGLPALAHVPFIKDVEGRSLLVRSSKTSALLEAFRMLRANIAFSSLDEPVRSIMVTSSQPGEGKSSAACNLAITMALAGKRVVLLDADLRLPTVHRQLNLPNRVGFTSVVAGQASLQDALQETDIKNLRAVTSGPLPPNPPELLDSRAARVVLGQIADECDFVIVDAPPGLALVDAQIVASLVDGALLVVSCQEASRGAVARVSSLLAQTGTKLLGTVVNKIPTGLDGHYGAYGYGAGGYAGAVGRYGRYLSDGNDNASADSPALPPGPNGSGRGSNGENASAPNNIGQNGEGKGREGETEREAATEALAGRESGPR